MKEKIIYFFTQYKIIASIYLIVAVLTALSKWSRGVGAYNNYLIFKGVYANTLLQRNLYVEYPEWYFDKNHYGILFSAIIAPFTFMPDWLGMMLWNLANVAVFLLAIHQLPFSQKYKALFAWLCLQELITALVSFQFNVALTGLIILSACYIYRQQEVKSALSILIGLFVKIYGIVGLSAFFFVKNKMKFILALVLGFGVFLVLPMLYSSPQFGLQAYADWYTELVIKNSDNQVLGNMQDISLMGFFRRIIGDASISNWVFLFPGLVVFALPYLRVKQYHNRAFQLLILSSTLLFTVLFSSGSESPTYIIAVAGVMIWYLIQKDKNKWVNALMIFVLLLTCFGMSDLYPSFIKKNYIIKYSLKALPCILVWLRVSYELLFANMEKNYQIQD